MKDLVSLAAWDMIWMRNARFYFLFVAASVQDSLIDGAMAGPRALLLCPGHPLSGTGYRTGHLLGQIEGVLIAALRVTLPLRSQVFLATQTTSVSTEQWRLDYSLARDGCL